MVSDLIEDFIAFLYATESDCQICPRCGAKQEVDESGELHCPICDE